MDYSKILDDPELMATFKDPEIMAALQDARTGTFLVYLFFQCWRDKPAIVGGTSLANPTSLILLTKLRSSKIFPGFRSRCTSGSGFVWWRKMSHVLISAAIRNLCCQESGFEFPL
ncbi:hypothetical protein POM88_034451 [Heracleum sosnowskyi]|uniref:Uncharacterized protein n=1 Tax=Heracleum sosnowskyi TaxID=360622 RepID=A0AAD8MD59_9APIA|nr:hypothetical protein POM88_034451 [Heracleum sosnowskyi]